MYLTQNVCTSKNVTGTINIINLIQNLVATYHILSHTSFEIVSISCYYSN